MNTGKWSQPLNMGGAVANIWSVVTVTLIASASGAFRYSGVREIIKI